MTLEVLDSPELVALAQADRILVCCDYDGTLAPIVADRDRAFPLPGAPEALNRLQRCPGVTVAVVSGRSVAVLKRLAGFGDEADGLDKSVQLVGSHGAEFAEGEFPGMGESERALLADLLAEATDITAGVPGADVEVKPVSVAVHTRRASSEDAQAVEHEVAARLLSRDEIFVTTGKAVVEIAVVHADKGEAMDILREQSGASGVLFVGDDVTDERAFAKLRAGDVGVKVGDGETAAAFRVADPAGTVTVLGRLADLRAC